MIAQISLSRDRRIPLYRQLVEALANAIEQDQIEDGYQLPTIAGLAKSLEVTQSTVIRAYEELAKSGLIASHVGRGTFVTRGRESSRIESEPKGPRFSNASTIRQSRESISSSLSALQTLAQRPGLVRFDHATPDKTIAEEGILERLALEALKAGQDAYAGYIPPPGLLALRKAVVKKYARHAVNVSLDQVLITNGCQHALSLLAMYARKAGHQIICESPCYSGIGNTFEAMGHRVETIPRDSKGPQLDSLRRFKQGRPPMLYFSPALQNPMGTDAAAERLNAVAEWSAGQQGLLISDEVFQDLRFKGEAPPSLKTWVDHGSAVVISSLSKSFMGGLRIGWLIANPELVEILGDFRRSMDIGSSSLMQGMAAALLNTGAYDDHIERARIHYQARRDITLKAIERHMPKGVKWTNPAGGFHMWVELPRGYSSVALYMLAIDRGVVITPGPMMDFENGYVNAFRLSYGAIDPEALEKGIETLGKVVGEYLNSEMNDMGRSGLGGFL